ncbi:dihydrofolate reductase [Natranaerovirga hydrolytica]|uniref:Dihydrofolate reductase n=1 Tax=Natranaerovirga hydrolytica TaxID=680378 RepID=A0A4R1MKK5_9FIRM|nr:dihydrofolate reductase [Natranaerovirga hydrolytica]TCK92352.1 dihydrofolate reductase [Natranaerovirga hydrolytica]
MNCIVAVEKNWGIGCQGRLLTYLPGDLKYFKEKTLDKVVILGRKTLSTFPNGMPLKGRTNIILTRDKNFQCEGAIVKHNVEDVLELIKEYDKENVFVIGGESIYNQFMDHCETAYVTKIHDSFQSDVFFPNLDEKKEWQLIEESHINNHNDIAYQFCVYKKVSK